MPQILVVTDDHDKQAERTVVYRERIAPSDFESAHFSGQLAERVGWAVSDAKQLERGGGNMPSDGERRGREPVAR